MLNASLVETRPVIPIELRASGTDDMLGTKAREFKAEAFLPNELSTRYVYNIYNIYATFYQVNGCVTRFDKAGPIRKITRWTRRSPTEHTPRPSSERRKINLVEVPHFEREFRRFTDSIYRRFNDGPFISFRSGAARGWEGYKPLLRDRALAALGATSWTDAQIGTGSILDHAVDAIELSGDNQPRNNLVSWEGRYGPGSASHAALLTARTDPTRRRMAERWLWDAFRAAAADDDLFERLRSLAGDG